MFSRVLYGARVSLEVAIVATALSVVLGVVLGMIAGYFRGWVDTVISRLIDVTARLPDPAARARDRLGLLARQRLRPAGLIKPGLPTVIVVIVVVNWTYIGRIIRGQVLSLREKEFVEAARVARARRTARSSSASSSRTSSRRSSSTRRS